MENKFGENKFLENKSGRIFCVRQVYKFLQINLGAWKPIFYFFIYTTSEEKEYYEALIIQTSYKMEYFTIFQDKLHSFNYSGPSKHAWAFNWWNHSKNVQNHLHIQPVLTLDKRQICEEIWRVTLQRDKEFIASIFY